MDKQVFLEDRVVVAALSKVGLEVASTQDLFKIKEPYPLAVPVLLEMLGRVKTYAMKEIIVRALAAREAKGKVERDLISEFESSLPDSSVDAQAFRWAIANTLETIGGKADVDDLIRLLCDPRSTYSRGLLSLAAAKTKDPKMIPILMEGLDSEDLQGFASRGLGRLRAEEAIPKLETLAAETPNSWVRREAMNALRRIRPQESTLPSPK